MNFRGQAQRPMSTSHSFLYIYPKADSLFFTWVAHDKFFNADIYHNTVNFP